MSATSLAVFGATTLAGLTMTSLAVSGPSKLGSLTATTLSAGVSSLGVLSAGATTVAALTAAATDLTTLKVSGATTLGGVAAAAISATSLAVSGATTLAGLTMTSLTVSGPSRLGSLNATTLSAGVSSLGVVSAGATTVAALTAAATTVTTLNASGAVLVGGAMTVAGAVAIGVNLTKTSGSFVIPHPDPEKRIAGKMLKHCFVESPTRGDNLYRFRIVTGDCRGRIVLPSYFWFLNEDVQAWVGGIDVLGFGRCTLTVGVLEALIEVSTDGAYSVLIMGTRCDELARKHFDGVEFQGPASGRGHREAR
jgi:tetrahydromethanopterin S-methyltransferase subunit C